MATPKTKTKKVRAYEFTVCTVGHGTTPKEAWAGACEHILDDFKGFADTSNLPDYKIVKDEDA